MITKIWFKRTEQNEPIICLASDAPEGVVAIDTFLITEELYDQWVPDTNHFPGESLSEGIEYDKPLIPNLKG